MEIIKKIIEPKHDRKPFYRTVEYEDDFSFDCDECGSKYISYCGIREFSNSAYLISLNEIIRINN